jgi:hypothetical protein
VLGPGRLLEQEKKQEQLKGLERQAARIEAFLVANEPKRGQQGHEVQSNVTDNESAKMFTAHGVLQGYNSQALVDAKHQIILQAGAFGNGQDYGHVALMLEGAKENTKPIGLGEEYFAGTIFSADRITRAKRISRRAPRHSSMPISPIRTFAAMILDLRPKHGIPLLRTRSLQRRISLMTRNRITTAAREGKCSS